MSNGIYVTYLPSECTMVEFKVSLKRINAYFNTRVPADTRTCMVDISRICKLYTEKYRNTQDVVEKHFMMFPREPRDFFRQDNGLYSGSLSRFISNTMRKNGLHIGLVWYYDPKSGRYMARYNVALELLSMLSPEFGYNIRRLYDMFTRGDSRLVQATLSNHIAGSEYSHAIVSFYTTKVYKEAKCEIRFIGESSGDIMEIYNCFDPGLFGGDLDMLMMEIAEMLMRGDLGLLGTISTNLNRTKKEVIM